MGKPFKAVKTNRISMLKNTYLARQKLRRRGVISVWLLLMLVIMVTGFAMLYQSLVGVYRINEHLRTMQTASRLVLSYYDAELYQGYELMAYEFKQATLEQVRTVTNASYLAFEPRDPATQLSNFQEQMIRLGKTEVIKGLAEQSKMVGEESVKQNDQLPQNETVPDEATEGKKPTERQRSIWQALKRFTTGAKEQKLNGLSEAIPQRIMDAVFDFDADSAKALSLTERYAVIAYVNDKFSSKFHRHSEQDTKPLKSSEIEYILGGYRTELQNGLALHMKLVASRMPMNIASIVGSHERRMAVQAMAATVIAVFPMSVLGAEAAIIGLWATVETEVEVSRLYSGKLIPLVKTPTGTWYTDIESIIHYKEDSASLSFGGELQDSKPGWINYDDQLNLFLGLQDDGVTAVRILRLIDVNLKTEGKSLSWQNLYTGIHVQVNERLKVVKGYLYAY